MHTIMTSNGQSAQCGGCDECWDAEYQCEYCGEDMTIEDVYDWEDASGIAIYLCIECFTEHLGEAFDDPKEYTDD